MTRNLPCNSHADTEFGNPLCGLGVERAENLVGNAIAARRFRFDNEHVWPGHLATLVRFELHASINCQSLTAFLGNEGDPLIFDENDGFERLVKLIIVAVAVAGTNKIHATIVKQFERSIDRHATLGSHRPLFVQLDFQEAEIGVNIMADARLAAFAPPLMMVIIATPFGIVEIASSVAEGPLALDFQYIENVGHRVERRTQSLCWHDVFIVDPLKHRGFGVERIKANRVVGGKTLGNSRVHGECS